MYRSKRPSFLVPIALSVGMGLLAAMLPNSSAAAETESDVVGYSASARANLAFVGVAVPLPALALGVPGATSDMSSDPESRALAVLADPGFVATFLLEESVKQTGSVPQYSAGCTNPASALPKDQAWPVAGTGTSGNDATGRSMAVAQASCPTPAHSRSQVTMTGQPGESLTVGVARSYAENVKRDDGMFESMAVTSFSEIVVGPLKIKGLEYRASAVAGQHGGAVARRSTLIGGIEINGQAVTGPFDVEQAGQLLGNVNAQLAPSGLSLALESPRVRTAPDGTAAEAEAARVILRATPEYAAAGGYQVSSAVYLGRAVACVLLRMDSGAHDPGTSCVLGRF